MGGDHRGVACRKAPRGDRLDGRSEPEFLEKREEVQPVLERANEGVCRRGLRSVQLPHVSRPLRSRDVHLLDRAGYPGHSQQVGV